MAVYCRLTAYTAVTVMLVSSMATPLPFTIFTMHANILWKLERIMQQDCISWHRLNVRESGRQKVCVSGLMENEVRDLKALVQVSICNFNFDLFLKNSFLYNCNFFRIYKWLCTRRACSGRSVHTYFCIVLQKMRKIQFLYRHSCHALLAYKGQMCWGPREMS